MIIIMKKRISTEHNFSICGQEVAFFKSTSVLDIIPSLFSVSQGLGTYFPQRPTSLLPDPHLFSGRSPLSLSSPLSELPPQAGSGDGSAIVEKKYVDYWLSRRKYSHCLWQFPPLWQPWNAIPPGQVIPSGIIMRRGGEGGQVLSLLSKKI
ncbi:hypothetical protein [Methanoregula sp.]|uniref:hypothetical protein n=1 Tax=Methanoregula sp. TaxID=2052170 RepID=UPI003C7865B6